MKKRTTKLCGRPLRRVVTYTSEAATFLGQAALVPNRPESLIAHEELSEVINFPIAIMIGISIYSCFIGNFSDRGDEGSETPKATTSWLASQSTFDTYSSKNSNTWRDESKWITITYIGFMYIDHVLGHGVQPSQYWITGQVSHYIRSR